MGDYILPSFHPLIASGSQKSSERSKACMKSFVMQDALSLHPTLSHINES